MNALSKLYLEELVREAEGTKRMLERVPLQQSDWQPHEKSYSIGILSSHIAEIPGWTKYIIEADHLDFANLNYTSPIINSTEDLMKLFEENLKIAKDSLSKSEDSKLKDNWTLKNGGSIYFTMERNIVLRNMVLNHVVHHRAQLGVYLRLLDIPVPGVYGPTADDQMG